MLQVNSSGKLPVRILTSAARSDGSVQTSQSLSAGSVETYAHIDAVGLYSQKPDPKGSVPSRGDQSKETAVSRNAFKDMLDANVATLSARTSQDQTSYATSGSPGGGSVNADGAMAPSAPARWSVSIEGGRIQLAANSAVR